MATSTHIKGLNLKDEEITEGKRVENLKDYTFLLAYMTFRFYYYSKPFFLGLQLQELSNSLSV